jgi:hypothetical protein
MLLKALTLLATFTFGIWVLPDACYDNWLVASWSAKTARSWRRTIALGVRTGGGGGGALAEDLQRRDIELKEAGFSFRRGAAG